MGLALFFLRLHKPHLDFPLRALLGRTQKCIHIGIPLSSIRVGRWSGLMCRRPTYEHSQEFPSPNRKAVRPPHQLDGELAPVCIKQKLSEHNPQRVMGHWECSTEQIRHAQHAALASDRSGDHFFAQTLSSRKTPMRKKI